MIFYKGSFVYVNEVFLIEFNIFVLLKNKNPFGHAVQKKNIHFAR